MSSIKVRSFAKINISLDIKGIREDGYHKLETVMQRISLCDEITVGWIPKRKPEQMETATDLL